ncbi:hypothetical protein D8674_026577 [Pyrus ussuriensis x Pyrus communis]|uniref:Uncharacterized protein n=1 Tax=Pyrus ussuriensis x Pyrus communis TaxID=2448454 RepID=A0A5N5IAA2_9ROSA|nr:hypothetical protein D8674_026577 [Pyrus ussuriensis x Pyrus communis]
MAILVMICEGLSHCASTIWELQEMRFAAIFDDVSLVAITIIMAATMTVVLEFYFTFFLCIHLGFGLIVIVEL